MKTLPLFIIPIVIMIVLLSGGCSMPQKNLVKYLDASIEFAKAEAEYEEAICLAEGKEKCQTAEKILEYVKKAELLRTFLEQPLETDKIDYLLALTDAVIAQMEQDGEKPEYILRAKQIRILLELCKTE